MENSPEEAHFGQGGKKRSRSAMETEYEEDFHYDDEEEEPRRYSHRKRAQVSVFVLFCTQPCCSMSFNDFVS